MSVNDIIAFCPRCGAPLTFEVQVKKVYISLGEYANAEITVNTIKHECEGAK